MKKIFFIISAITMLFGTANASSAQIKISTPNVNIDINEEQLNEIISEVADALCECNITINGKSINEYDNDDTPNRIKGSGKIISKTIPAISYDAIKASRGARVVVEEREDENIIIRADDNLMPYVVVRKEGKSLRVTIDDNVKTATNITLEVYLPKNTEINELTATSAATINVRPTIQSRSLSLDATSAAKINFAKAEVEFFDADAASSAKVSGTLKSNDCYLEASSASEIDLTLLAVLCSADASSAAKISLSGETAKFEADASSAAKISATKLTVRTEAECDASSAAKISVNAIKRLDAEASSGAVVTYVPADDLVKSIKQSSGGRVKTEY